MQACNPLRLLTRHGPAPHHCTLSSPRPRPRSLPRIPVRAPLISIPRRSHATSTSHPGPNAAAQEPELYDILLIGGGPVGLTLLNTLRAQPNTSALKVALVDASPLTSSPTASSAPSTTQQASGATFSNRCVSLTPASKSLLQDIGAWKHIQHKRIQPYNRMNVWDGITGSKINFDWAGAGVAASQGEGQDGQGTIAHMAETSNIVSALLRRAQETNAGTDEAEILDKTTVSNISLGEDTPDWDMRSYPLVSLSNGRTIAPRLLIGADGQNSPVRTFAGIESHGWDYGRMGVVATVKLSEEGRSAVSGAAGQGTAYQRFLPPGPIALLPLPDGYASLVWSTLPGYASRLKSLSGTDMAAMINAGFRLGQPDLEYLHGVPDGQVEELEWRVRHTPFDNGLVPPMVEEVREGSVAAFPLKMRHADTYTGERVALVGDAAHTVHPLAGQGLNAGLADVRALAEVVVRAASVGSDIGSTIALEDYNRMRYAQNYVLLGVCDKLHKVFSWSSGPVVWGRSAGFEALDRLEPVKGFLMRRAAGG